MQRILVIQLARMGDLLQSSPLIQGIREKYADAFITLLVSEKTKDLANGIPGVEEVLALDFGKAYRIVNEEDKGLSLKHHRFSCFLNGLRGRSFDHVYNLNYSPVSAGLMGLIEYDKALGYSLDKGRRRILKSPWLRYLFCALEDRRLNRFNLVDIYLRSAGLTPSECSPRFKVEDKARESAATNLAHQGVKQHDRLVGFQLGAGDEIRCWPPESYVRLAELLGQRPDVKIVLFGAPSETALGDGFRGGFHGSDGNVAAGVRVIDLVGKTSVQELAAFLERCDLLVTPDTGTMHLAVAVGTRVLALFMGSACCHETGPYGNDHLVLEPNLECYPCLNGQQGCSDPQCKTLISPEAVAQVIGGILPEIQTGPMKTDFELEDSGVRLLRSRLGPGFVEYVPVKKIPFSLEDVLSVGYRAMWQGVIEGNWPSETRVVETALSDFDTTTLSEDVFRGIDRLEKDFDRLEKIIGAYALPSTGKQSLMGFTADRLANVLNSEQERSARWIKPIPRFFNASYDDIQRSGTNPPGDLQRRIAGLLRGAGFMRRFCKGFACTGHG
jgi:ADP-heptose:LPS heptosyltransferase